MLSLAELNLTLKNDFFFSCCSPDALLSQAILFFFLCGGRREPYLAGFILTANQ